MRVSTGPMFYGLPLCDQAHDPCDDIVTFSVDLWWKQGTLSVYLLVLLVPPIVFVLFLIYKLRVSVKVLKETKSNVLSIYFTFVWSVCVFNMLCLLAILFIPEQDRIVSNMVVVVMDIVLEFVEVSVAVFMLHYDTKLPNVYVLKRTAIISGIVSLLDNLSFVAAASWGKDSIGRLNQGGSLALYNCLSSVVFFMFYAGVLVLHLLPRFKDKLPERKAFYIYISFLAFINFLNILGAILSLSCVPGDTCLSALAKFCYFSFYAPVLYFSFLSPWLKRKFLDQLAMEIFDEEEQQLVK